ncbi:MAG: hypothetical protein NTV80_16300 [Verrucomicrobia bacterium]|nr:hypothetical protein [Verrucomicrobiota bacterium]
MLQRSLDSADLEIAIRGVKQVTGCLELVIGGRGALVAWAPDSAELLRTVDFDVGITQEGGFLGLKEFDEKLGIKSEFSLAHGFYIEHAGESLLTDRLAEGWRERAHCLEIDGVVALCLAPMDIVMNKLDARRPKDFEHVALMIQIGIITETAIEEAISNVPYTFLIPTYREALDCIRAILSRMKT